MAPGPCQESRSIGWSRSSTPGEAAGSARILTATLSATHTYSSSHVPAQLNFRSASPADTGKSVPTSW